MELNEGSTSTKILKSLVWITTMGTVILTILNWCTKKPQTNEENNWMKTEQTINKKILENEKNKNKLNEKYNKIDLALVRDSTLITKMENEHKIAESTINRYQNQISEYKRPWESDAIEKIIFKKWAEKQDEIWTYIIINWKKYYKRKEWCNGNIYIPLCNQEIHDEEKFGEISITWEWERGYYSYLWECNDWLPNWKWLLLDSNGWYNYWIFKNWKYTWIWYTHEEGSPFDNPQWYVDYYNKWPSSEVVKLSVEDGNTKPTDIYFQWELWENEIIESNKPEYSIYGWWWTEFYHYCKWIAKLPDWSEFKSDNFTLVNPYNGKQNLIIEWKWIITYPNWKKIIWKIHRWELHKIQDLTGN